jgi:hypothetical protein
MMPDIGDIVHAYDLGRIGSRRYIWAECPDCHLQRWATTKPLNKGTHRRCQPCIRASIKREFKIGRALTDQP